MLKIGKLPDQTPLKLTITASAALNRDLQDYAAVYQAVYGEKASIAALVPHMLESFLKSDQAFAKAKREGLLDKKPASPARSFAAPKQNREAATPSHPTQAQQED